MDTLYWVAICICGAIFIGTGTLAWTKNPRRLSTALLLIGTISITVALFSGRITEDIGESNPDLATATSKVFLSSVLLSTTLFWQISLTFPVTYDIQLRRPNPLGILMIGSMIVSVGVGFIAKPDIDAVAGNSVVDSTGATVMLLWFVGMGVMSTILTFSKRRDASPERMHSGTIYVLGLWMTVVAGSAYSLNIILGNNLDPNLRMLPRAALIGIITVMMVYFASVMIQGGATIALAPGPERLASASKSKYNLLLRRVYVVEEQKPSFAMSLFIDILKGRCYACEDDESFACESVDCSSCTLPCPCRSCQKYKSRTQGLIVTRMHPKEVRKNLYLQTTPVIWLSTVAGKDNMDPAKLSLLTDFLAATMEKLQNGIVLVEGIEYLATTNDFQRVLKAIDRWTETAMTSSTRLIISLNPEAFDEKELAMIERHKEIVRPGSKDTWRVIPEPI